MLIRKKRSIHVPGITHGKTPIPMGARVGPLIYSSGISGKDPAIDKLPEDAVQQVAFAFKNMQTLVEAAGGALADIVRVTVLIKDNSIRDHVNEQWLQMFPDPEDRPARHAQLVDLQAGMLLQLEIVAFVQGS